MTTAQTLREPTTIPVLIDDPFAIPGVAAERKQAPAKRAKRCLSPTHAFYLQASIVLFFLAGSSAPTPLYAAYQAEWGFGASTITVIFGVYAIAVLAGLLVFGRLSDHVGRRPILLVALVLQAATMVVFATAGGVDALLIARTVQGLSTGAAVGAVGAGMLDLNVPKGTIANGVAPMMGTAIGGLLAGVLVEFLPAPMQLVYLLLLGVFLLQLVGVAFMNETSSRKAGAVASLRPSVAVPSAARGAILVAIPVLVAVWSLAGFYASLGPSLVRVIVGSDAEVLGGLALFVLAGSGALTVFSVRNQPPHLVMRVGAFGLIVGVGLTLLAMTERSATEFFIGAVIAGAGFGAGFQGGLRTVVPLAAPHERAGVLSVMYVVCYLALGLPAVIAGLVVGHEGVLTTARGYSAAIIFLVLMALAGMAAQARRAQVSQPIRAAPRTCGAQG